jgi:hypothetical protein
MADTVITPEVNPNKLFMHFTELKADLFDMYKAERWPAELEEDYCANYSEKEGSCLEQDIEPCASCATYDRLAKEFQGLPVG